MMKHIISVSGTNHKAEGIVFYDDTFRFVMV